MFQGLTIANVVGIPEASQMKALFAALIQQLQTYGPGLLNAQSASVGNAADTTDDVLHTYTLPATFLATLGTNKGLRIKAWGVSAANGNNKQFKLWFGSVNVASGVVTINNKSWHAEVLVVRSGVSTQSILGEAQSDATGIADSVLAGTEDETATITIKSTGASGTTGAANDLLGKGFMVEVIQ